MVLGRCRRYSQGRHWPLATGPLWLWACVLRAACCVLRACGGVWVWVWVVCVCVVLLGPWVGAGGG